eukprot:3454854-Amphidinium_carterae.1
MPHGEKPLSPAPAPRIASANQGSRVFGLSYPFHRLPPEPVQSGHCVHSLRERQLPGLTGAPSELTGVHSELTGVSSELTG